MLISSTYEREICRIVLPVLRAIVSVKLILRFHSLEKKTDMREEIWSLIFFNFLFGFHYRHLSCYTNENKTSVRHLHLSIYICIVESSHHD
jgi:hypothetical protein